MTVNDDQDLYEHGTVLVNDGEIIDVRPSKPEDGKLDAEVVIDGTGKLVMPGLVNTHTHVELSPTMAGHSDLGDFELWGYNAPLLTGMGKEELDHSSLAKTHTSVV